MSTEHPNEPDPRPTGGAENPEAVDRERARADAAEALNHVRAASPQQLADLTHDLRCQMADLTDDAHSSLPVRLPHLRNVTARMNGLADTLSRAAHGYTGARATDMLYPGIDDDLDAHQWNPRPDRELDGTLPPIPIAELSDQRGYRRGWHRGQQQITLWFTGPDCLAYAQADGHGRLADVDQVRALITSPPLSAKGQPNWVARPKPAEPFNATYVRVVDHLRATWGSPIETHSCDEHGIRRPDGPGSSTVWGRPSNPDFRVYVWGLGQQPAHVRYWAGSVADMEHLIRITGAR